MVPDGKWGQLRAPLHLLLVISRTTWQNCLLLAESKRRIVVKKHLWFFCREQNYVPAGSFEDRNVVHGLLLVQLTPGMEHRKSADPGGGSVKPMWSQSWQQPWVRMAAPLLALSLDVWVPPRESWQLSVHRGVKSPERWAVGSKRSQGRKNP